MDNDASNDCRAIMRDTKEVQVQLQKRSHEEGTACSGGTASDIAHSCPSEQGIRNCRVSGESLRVARDLARPLTKIPQPYSACTEEILISRTVI